MMSVSEVKRLSLPYVQLIDDAIDYAFTTSSISGSSVAESMCNYARAGKKVRSLSLILCVAAHRPNLVDKRAVRAAAAVELAHRSTLISDDVADGEPVRNGITTLHKSLGKTTAVFAGPFMQAMALDLCPVEFSRELNKSLERTLAGQILQDSHIFRDLIQTKRERSRIVDLKAGSIEVAALTIAASIVGQDIPEVTKRVGLEIGRAYQNCNDLADVLPWIEDRSNALPGDLARRVYSNAIISAMENADEKQSSIIRTFMQSSPKRGQYDVSRLRTAFLQADIRNHLNETVDEHLSNAYAAIHQWLPPSELAAVFEASVTYFWKNQYMEARG